MNKLKIKIKKYNLLNYQHFLINDSLKKKNKYKLKNILFENQILYKNQDLNIIEFENSENIEIPITVLDIRDQFTIDHIFEYHFNFNYNITYNLIYNFNKIIINYKIFKNKNINDYKIKKDENMIFESRIITGNFKKITIIFLGFTFFMKRIYLNKIINNKRTFYHKKRLTRKDYILFRDKKSKRIITCYKCRPLYFKIHKIKKKYFFSRISYVNDVLKYISLKYKEKKNENYFILKKTKKIKNNFFRKQYVKKSKSKYKTNYASI